ncbi:cytochrome P450 4V2-like [Anabrus simplex]|uniref:cytochrome P450 4V2-like n=1 Tax=Anabrus simplex TaxID=316456 RepID=UPI0035A33689
MRVWLGPLLFVSLLNAEDIECLMIKHRIINHDHYLMKVYAPILGNGLIMSRGEEWKKQRRIIAPTLHIKVVETYTEVFNKQANILITKLKQLADGRTFDVYELLSLCALDMVCESSMGINMDVQKDESSNLGRTINNLIRISTKRSLRPWLSLDSIYYWTAMGKEEKRNTKMLNNIGQMVISNKMKEFLGSESTSGSEEGKKKSFLVHYMSSKKEEGSSFSEKELRDAVNNIMFGGQETTSSTMSFTLMFLALHPQIQEEVYQELRDVFADDWKRPVEPEDVKRMEYLDRVIKETLRMVPPVVVYTREISEEVKLHTCTLPAGCSAVIFSYVNHRNPKYFPDPERFDPDRFLPERCRERHPYSYIPFGVGPRMCVGIKYAEIAMAVVLATVLKSYRVLPVMTQEALLQLEIGIVARPVSGFKIKMLPR